MPRCTAPNMPAATGWNWPAVEPRPRRKSLDFADAKIALPSPLPATDSRMPSRWRRFYVRQILLLAVSGLALGLLFHFTTLDLRLAEPWYDPAAQLWPQRRAWWSSVLVHKGTRSLMALVAIAVWVVWWRFRHRVDARRWLWLALSSVLVPLLIASGKRFTAMHCPWDVDRFGGYAPYFDVFSAAPAGIAAGHCFPAAFVTSVSWLMALGLFWYPRRPRLGWALAIASFALTLALGWVQQIRGAHFLSHTLWSIWASWAVIVALHSWLKVWRLDDEAAPVPSSAADATAAG